MSASELAVVLYGRHIADVRQSAGGQFTLRYRDERGDTPLSLSMPLVQTEHRNRTVKPFLDGLLPDRDDVRAEMGREFGVNGRNAFQLLRHVGLDCAGAIQFCDPANVADVLERRGTLQPISEDEIGARLAALQESRTRSWVAPAERWSLAGAQAKFALHRTNDGWFEARGASPTTHIIKPGVASLHHQALNEHICMVAAGRLGLDVASSEYIEFDGQPAVVVRRYDRRVSPRGRLVRVHQEDLCQAMSVAPEQKYETDGGPGAARILQLLRGSARLQDRYAFLQYQAYNYLVGGSDAHAKNFSLLLIGRTVRLAPMYDVASSYPYEGLDHGLPIAIDGKRAYGSITDSNWANVARRAELDPDRVVDHVHSLAARLPDALSDTVAALREDGVVHIDELANRMLPQIGRVCAAIQRQHRFSGQPSPTTGTARAKTTPASNTGSFASPQQADAGPDLLR